MPLPAAPRPICPTVLWRRLTSERRVALMRAASVTTAVPCWRSEEHTSELQSQSNLVCRLLLEKKKPDLFIRLEPPPDPSPILRHSRPIRTYQILLRCGLCDPTHAFLPSVLHAPLRQQCICLRL